MRLKKLLIFSIAVLMITMFMASCGGTKEAEKTERVVIGVSAPLTGPGADYGQDVTTGLEMAAEAINADGGITIGDTKYTFEIRTADDQATPDPALANASRFVLEDGVNIIWNAVATTIGPLMGVNTKAGEEFLLMAYTSFPLYAQSPNALMVTIPPPFTVYIKSFTTLAMQNGWMKMGMLQTTGAYGDQWGKTLSEAWTAAGGTVVASAPASYYTVTDFTPNITTVLAASPDVLFVGGPSDATALVIEQARGLGFKGGFIVADQAKLDVIAERTGMEELEGAIGVLPVELGDETAPAMTDFIKDYEAKYSRTATWEAAINYTAFHILTEAMMNAGSVDDIEAIRAAFADSSVTSGDELPVVFYGFNDTTGALWMPGNTTQVINGEFTNEGEIQWWKQ